MKCRKKSIFEKSTLLWAIVAVLFISFSERSFASVNEVNEVAAISQQGRTVTGRIVDATGEPVIGATIIEVGSNPINGTITNFDGEYTLVLTTANPALNISFIGFQEITENVGARSIVNIVLQEYVSFLDELVVVGYGTMRRRDLTGAVATVRTENILRETPRSVQDLLRGNVAGLSMGMATGASGASSMLLRGDNRLLTQGQRDAGRTSEPLVVLDGVIFHGALSDINPQDIASVDILKDASSAAVFGARAASGVIVIMTQRGARGGRPQINFNTSVGVVQAASTREIHSPEGYLNWRRSWQIHRWGSPVDAFPSQFDDPRRLPEGVSQLDWFNHGRPPAQHVTSVTEEELLRAWASRLVLSPLEIDNFILGRTTNWQDEIFQLGLQQDYHISVSHRTDDVSYFWSMSWADREGIIVDDRFQRFSTRLNLESTVRPFLRVGIHAGFSSRDNSFLNQSSSRHGYMRGMQTYLSPFMMNEIGNPDVPLNVQRFPSGSTTEVNQFFDNQFRTRRDRLNTFNANPFAVITLPFNIEYRFDFTALYHRRDFFDHQSAENPQWAGNGGRVERYNRENYSWQIDNRISWNQRFNQIHSFNVTLLQNVEKEQRWRGRMIGNDFMPSDVLGFHRIQAALRQEVDSSDDMQTGSALMARVHYSLLDRYMLTTTVRRDGFSAFGRANPHALFFAVAGAWTFTSENFAQSFNHIMDFGRLRLSWGENGNRDVGRYDALADLVSGEHPFMMPGGQYFFLHQLRVERMANHNLRWERTSAANIGLDFSFLNGLVGGSFEVYTGTTIDLLMRRNLPNVLGYDWVTANLGELRNRGFDATLRARPIQNRNFTWETSGNFSLNRREIVRLHGDMVDIFDADGNVIGQREANDYVNQWFIGQDPDRIWDFQRDGVWQEGETDDVRPGWRVGDFRFIDQDGNGVLNNDDRVFQGYRTPRFRWAWRNDFTFLRDFTASTSIYSAWGHYRTFNLADNNPAFIDRRSFFVQPYWTPENRRNDFARPGSHRLGNNWVRASFIRFDNFTLSYNIPRNVIQRASIEQMRITAGVRNVAIWSPHWHWHDAETGVATPRTYHINLNFTL